MQRRENNVKPQPLGICHRLFNLIMNTLLSRSFKRLTEEGHRRKGEEGGSDSPSGGNKLDSISSSEIMVDFRHTNGLENLTSDDKSSSLVQKGFEEMKKVKENELPIVQGFGNSSEISISQNLGKFDKGKGMQEIEVEGKGPIKSLSIKDRAEDTLKKKKTTQDGESDQQTQMQPPRLRRPLLSVVPNINERSVEFIRRRREAMRRNLSLDQKKP